MKTLGTTRLGTVLQLTPDDWKEWNKEAVADVDVLLEAETIDKPTRRSEVAFIRGTYVGVLYQSDIYALQVGDKIVSLNISHMGKKRRCAWGKYVNLYYAYTEMSRRRKGLATTLQKFLEQYWKDAGQDRLKSTAGSYGGFRFHRSLGHPFWGANDKGELVVDAPLIAWGAEPTPTIHGGFFATTPRHARAVTTSLVPMTREQLIAHLVSDDCPYKITASEAKELK